MNVMILAHGVFDVKLLFMILFNMQPLAMESHSLQLLINLSTHFRDINRTSPSWKLYRVHLLYSPYKGDLKKSVPLTNLGVV